MFGKDSFHCELEHYILERPLVKEVRNSTSWHPQPSTKKLLGIILLTQPTKQTFLVRGALFNVLQFKTSKTMWYKLPAAAKVFWGLN